MAEPFLAEIKIFAGNFAPRGWAFCDGQLLPISQNTALFSLIGTTYGGDGRTTTQLPDMQGRAPMHPGHGAGLPSRTLGETGGTAEVTLTAAQMGAHHHGINAIADAPNNGNPQNAMTGQIAGRSGGTNLYGATANATMAPAALDEACGNASGGANPHNNIGPSLGMYFIIALQGQYPSRS